MSRYTWLEAWLSEQPGSVRDYKIEWGWLRWRVGEKLFGAICRPGAEHGGDYGGHELLTLKCEPRLAVLLRGQYPDILPGFYMDKHNWISIRLDGAVPDNVVRDLCVQSYGLVFGKLTKKLRGEIEEAAHGGT